jgi:hypothetical protein
MSYKCQTEYPCLVSAKMPKVPFSVYNMRLQYEFNKITKIKYLSHSSRKEKCREKCSLQHTPIHQCRTVCLQYYNLSLKLHVYYVQPND